MKTMSLTKKENGFSKGCENLEAVASPNDKTLHGPGLFGQAKCKKIQ